jgi:hypothetical protein
MAQAHIALETVRRPSALMARWTAFRQHARDRREVRRLLAKILEERELGRVTGARV